jgi:hypothetical protein
MGIRSAASLEVAVFEVFSIVAGITALYILGRIVLARLFPPETK